MIISHECPACLLEESRKFNDYDYALVHLFPDHPDYFEFFVESLRMGRTVILDNSLYELGEAFDMKEYAYWINKLHPTAYIVPDAFWDSQKTIELSQEWMLSEGRYLSQDILTIGVAQGSTYKDIVRSYKYMDAVCDIIAFTFKFHPDTEVEIKWPMLELYNTNTNTCTSSARMFINNDINTSIVTYTDTDKQAWMRYEILRRLMDAGIINTNKWHHLLGIQNTCMLTRMVKDFPWLRSIDTSNPVILGMGDTMYGPVYERLSGYSAFIYNGNALQGKPISTINGIFECSMPDQDIMDKIYHNIHCFRDIVSGNIVEIPVCDIKGTEMIRHIITQISNDNIVNPMKINNIICDI